MVLSKLMKAQAAKRRKKLIQSLQFKAKNIMLDRTSHDINDNLATILAIAENESDTIVGHAKEHIKEINDSINDLRHYQVNVHRDAPFDMELIVKNTMAAMEAHYKGRLSIDSRLAGLKAFAAGNQSKFEEVLLNIMVMMSGTKSKDPVEILVELKQKDADAMLTLMREGGIFNALDMELVAAMQKEFSGKILITQENDLEVVIKLPLQFDTVPQPTTKVTLKKPMEAISSTPATVKIGQ